MDRSYPVSEGGQQRFTPLPAEVAAFASALADRYILEREIGRGGMATVYLARDLRHARRVALKVLNTELGAVLGAERFLAEIRVTANLQHPNLLPLFDSGAADGKLFYVMPFVEGESLRARLNREKQLPIDEAVHISAAVAAALDYAHRHGVVHRDLKPENILLQAGQPVVADFGIALAVSNAGGARVTQTGISLGTPQYMSPEQATGDREIDGRSDIYSLAAVTYEMLTGEPPHTGPTSQSVIAKLLTDDIRPLTMLRRSVPAHMDDAVRRGLEKLPADRFATARELADALQGKVPVTPAPSRGGSRRAARALALAGSAAAGAIVGVTLWSSWQDRPNGQHVARLSIQLPADAQVASESPTSVGLGRVWISPDGRTVVYRGRMTDGRSALFARPLDDVHPRRIAGTENANGLMLSSDGRWVAFEADGQLRKVPIGGGQPSVVIDTLPGTRLSGATWMENDTILFSDGLRILAVAASGGATRTVIPAPVVSPSERQLVPTALPGGRAFLFSSFVWSAAKPDFVLVFATVDGSRRVVTGLHGVANGFMQGHLLYIRTPDLKLMAVPFDPRTGRVLGESRETGEAPAHQTTYSIARNGTLLLNAASVNSRLELVTRAGTSRPLPVEPRNAAAPRFSPDGRRIVFSVTPSIGSGGEIWILEMPSLTLRRLAAGNAANHPEWSPDGRTVAFCASDDLNAGFDIWAVPADGSAEPSVVRRLPGNQYDPSWTADGKSVLYVYDDPDPAHGSIGLMEIATGKTMVWLATAADERSARVSPRGDLIAYTSNVSGRREVYVTTFPRRTGSILVSTDGGSEPMWSRDGRELFYRSANKLIAVGVTRSSGIEILSRRTLFDRVFVTSENDPQYDVSPDGSTFVMLQRASTESQLTVVLGWDAFLRR
jgi:eukaryotic-like serine/threonine-protein kinase